MSRSIDLSKAAQKFLKRLDLKQRQQLLTCMAHLRDVPAPHDSKQLANFHPVTRRVDAGEYRIAYRFTDTEVNILLVGKRNDDEIYRKLKRLR